MPQLSLQITDSLGKEKLRKEQLLAIIRKKKEELNKLVLKVEMLRVNLEMAKKEYMLRVGSLLVKDSSLDLQIIRYRNILRLMENGYTYNQAVKKLSKTYYSKQLEKELREDGTNYEGVLTERKSNIYHSTHGDIKKLWKRLIAKFHPDLVQDPKEKLRRDAIMKQINHAYQEEDYDLLVRIDRDNDATSEDAITNLEETLLKLIHEIELQVKTYKSLRTSQWYGWMEKIIKAKKKNSNIFAQTEKKLLDDIASKIAIVKSLQNNLKTRKKVSPQYT